MELAPLARFLNTQKKKEKRRKPPLGGSLGSLRRKSAEETKATTQDKKTLSESFLLELEKKYPLRKFFFRGSFRELKRQAKTTNRPIFLVVYSVSLSQQDSFLDVIFGDLASNFLSDFFVCYFVLSRTPEAESVTRVLRITEFPAIWIGLVENFRLCPLLKHTGPLKEEALVQKLELAVTAPDELKQDLEDQFEPGSTQEDPHPGSLSYELLRYKKMLTYPPSSGEEGENPFARSQGYKLNHTQISDVNPFAETPDKSKGIETADETPGQTPDGSTPTMGGLKIITKAQLEGTNLEISDEGDYLAMTSDEYCVKMPCGHAWAPTSLTMYVQNLLNKPSRPTEIICACGQVWPYLIVQKAGMFTDQEREAIEEKLGFNYADQKLKTFDCPKCRLMCAPSADTTRDNPRVVCSNCSTEFCSVCLKLWEGVGSSSTVCNACASDPTYVNEILKNSPTKDIDSKNVGIPIMRCCPRLSEHKYPVLIEHKEACKHMKCYECKKEFCFVCLSLKQDNDSWPCNNYNDLCTKAPPQVFTKESFSRS